LPNATARSYRLSGRGAYDALFAAGRRRDGTYVQLLSLPAGVAPGRAGYAIPKKLLPLAVDRNRVRRLLREAVRAARPAVLAFDVILRVRRGCPRGEFRRMRTEAGDLLASLVSGGVAR
jgi:ribonuclease P protein component